MAGPDRSRLRLVVLQVVVMSLLLTLGGRLWYLQMVAGAQYQQAAASNRIREILTPAPRGNILDSRGVPLVRNEVALVVSVNRTALLRQRDRGRALLGRVAEVTGRPAQEVWERSRLCGEKDAPAPPRCWNGSPYSPIPVVLGAEPQRALQILERREEFPGVTAELTPQRHYPAPGKVNAAHLLGHVGPVSEAELQARTAQRAGRRGDRATEVELRRTDVVGRGGLERQYDAALRGTPGSRRLAVDHEGGVTGTVSETAGTPGNHLVTSIDVGVQAAVERELAATITRARTEGDPNDPSVKYKADSGAAVVLDVKTGRVVAMASYPTYDPGMWVGGILQRDYDVLAGEKLNYPLVNRGTSAEVAPASTFKPVTMAAAVQAGFPLGGGYECSSEYRVGDRSFRNYESRAYGVIGLEKAMNVSCDTIFYRFADELWRRDGGIKPVPAPRDDMLSLAKASGFGTPTGIDLPTESAGRVADRQWKRRTWEANRERDCAYAKAGDRELAGKDPARAAYLQQLAQENCEVGYQYRGGDAVNFSIGQGDTTVTPLQLARFYAAIANGGTMWVPQLAKGVVAPDGQVVQEFAPKAGGQLPIRPEVLRFLQQSLRSTTTNGTARAPFLKAKFPLDRLPVATKTGTGEVYGKQNTSWLASYAPAHDPQFAVVMMVSQGGTGSGTAGPGVANIYKAIFGVDASGAIDPAKAILPGSRPPARLPRLGTDGVLLAPPPTPTAPTPAAPAASAPGRPAAPVPGVPAVPAVPVAPAGPAAPAVPPPTPPSITPTAGARR